jgi:hypothetical protein
VIAVFVLLILVLLSDRPALVIPQIPDGSNPIHQADKSSKVMSQAIEPIPAESP